MSAVMERPGPKSTDLAPENDVLYEVVNGQWVELPPMGAKENSLANGLHILLSLQLQSHPVGRAFQEMLFRLDGSGSLERRPDVAVVLYERWPERVVPDAEAWEMIPALAVEVVSKSNKAVEILDKIYDYFHHGVSLVWVIYPKQHVIYVYESLKSVRVLNAADTLDGGKVLPDFRLPLSELFEEPARLP